MKLKLIEIENFRAIREARIPLHPNLTAFHGDNAHGKTSILNAIAIGLGAIPTLLPGGGGITYKKGDVRHGARVARVAITTTGNLVWDRSSSTKGLTLSHQKVTPTFGLKQLQEFAARLVDAEKERTTATLPIIAYYGTDRAVSELPQRRGKFTSDFQRFAALRGALEAKSNFKAVFEWFYAKENEELREQKRRRDFRLPDLNAVRRAIVSMVPGASDPRTEVRPLGFVVTLRLGDGLPETLTLDQLSGGYRIVLALAADLARRMAQGNPHLADPLQSEAVVLIDEVELHLHPRWQQHVLGDLLRTFPNAQFIVSTHSAPVLSTVMPEQVIHLKRTDGGIVAGRSDSPTYGAEAGDILSTVMGVPERPPENRFSEILAKYRELVDHGEGESWEAHELRRQLEELSPGDPALYEADVEIKRRKLLQTISLTQ